MKIMNLKTAHIKYKHKQWMMIIVPKIFKGRLKIYLKITKRKKVVNGLEDLESYMVKQKR